MVALISLRSLSGPNGKYDISCSPTTLANDQPAQGRVYHRPSMFAALFLVLAPTLVAAAAGQYRILHRVFGPGVPEQNFIPRATLDSTSLQLIPVPGAQDSLAQFYLDVNGNKEALYQIALQAAPDGDEFDPTGERLDISTVKLVRCPYSRVVLLLTNHEFS